MQRVGSVCMCSPPCCRCNPDSARRNGEKKCEGRGQGSARDRSRFCGINESRFTVGPRSISFRETVREPARSAERSGISHRMPFYFMSSSLAKRKWLKWTDFKKIESNVSQCAASGQLHSVFVRNWSIANQSGSLLIQREPNCVKLIKSDGCVCFHSWLRCSAEPLSLYFIRNFQNLSRALFFTPLLSR